MEYDHATLKRDFSDLGEGLEKNTTHKIAKTTKRGDVWIHCPDGDMLHLIPAHFEYSTAPAQA